MEDQNIWRNIVADDMNALKRLHDKYYSQLFLWACKYLQQETVIEELVSDCFIKLWNRRKYIIIEKSLKAYIFLVLRNQIVSYIRKDKNKFEVKVKELPEVPTEESINEQEYYANLYKAIQRIPEQRRKILELAVFESLTYREIADRLDISINTVKTQIARSYQFLKEELDPKDFVLLHFHCIRK
ncbi:RNA polymerase sigma factor [Sunxiuqinia indica]|uniref:RNA polymerase sigma factor n=1 Tax=Sunxiuqinia indica TaxID=2692584 RepID=UPI00135AF8C0|nr:sigma-70 family RNA polymerase sigma factor [Sunxiuqinia indica]